MEARQMQVPNAGQANAGSKCRPGKCRFQMQARQMQARQMQVPNAGQAKRQIENKRQLGKAQVANAGSKHR
eukprot:362866-Chlamydomonas_euryale.AAC.2